MTRTTDTFLDRLGHWMAGRLNADGSGYEPYTPSDPEILWAAMRPGDVLLVEGDHYLARVIKYLTMSTWSHSAVHVGPIQGANEPDGEPHVLVEVNVGEGCISAPLSKYASYNTRICRPVGLSQEDRRRVVEFMVSRLGLRYDMKKIFDLLRYFFPIPVPTRFRRRMIALGSGDPTRAICSSLIAQAFQSVRYPILPRIERSQRHDPKLRRMRREIYYIRHHSLFAPRDFDLSPYFAVVKPTIERGFDYRRVAWQEEREESAADPAEAAAAAAQNAA
jgi:hypothetical protein